MLPKKQPTPTDSSQPTVQNEHNLVFTANGTPLHTAFNDVYFNQSNGAAEARYVFLDGNYLAERFAKVTDTFTITELGFGTGLNFFLTAQLWQEKAPTTARLKFISYEKYPLALAEIQRALSPWAELQQTELFKQFSVRYTPDKTGWQEIQAGNITLHLAIGDIADYLPQQSEAVDAWFLDGFAPAKNPDMWTADIFNAMVQQTKVGGTFATFTAAGVVKKGLAEAGFQIERIKGYAHKRHMLVGRKAESTP